MQADSLKDILLPRGPEGEKRPTDVITSAHMVFQIAIGEDDDEIPSAAAVAARLVQPPGQGISRGQIERR